MTEKTKKTFNRSVTGGRIYEQREIDEATRTDRSGLRITRESTPWSKITFKKRFISFVTFGIY